MILYSTVSMARTIQVVACLLFLVYCSCSENIKLEGKYELKCNSIDILGPNEIDKQFTDILLFANFYSDSLRLSELYDFYPSQLYNRNGRYARLDSRSHDTIIYKSVSTGETLKVFLEKEKIKIRTIENVDDYFIFDAVLSGDKIYNNRNSIKNSTDSFFSNKIFTDLSENLNWVFTNDNRVIISKINSNNNYTRAERFQFYSIERVDGIDYFHIHGYSDENYKITIYDEGIQLHKIGCDGNLINLHFLKDTVIEPQSDLYERVAPGKIEESYFAYSMETSWYLNFYEDGFFIIEPDGHFNSQQIYAGEYQSNMSVLNLSYVTSEIGGLERLWIDKLFKYGDSTLITSRGMVFNRTGYNRGELDLLDIPNLIYKCESKFASQLGINNLKSRDRVKGEIISVDSEIIVSYKLLSKDRDIVRELGEMNLSEMADFLKE